MRLKCQMSHSHSGGTVQFNMLPRVGIGSLSIYNVTYQTASMCRVHLGQRQPHCLKGREKERRRKYIQERARNRQTQTNILREEEEEERYRERGSKTEKDRTQRWIQRERRGGIQTYQNKAQVFLRSVCVGAGCASLISLLLQTCCSLLSTHPEPKSWPVNSGTLHHPRENKDDYLDCGGWALIKYCGWNVGRAG